MDYEPKANLPIEADDGFNFADDDDAARSIIKGTKLKFTNAAQWETGGGEKIAADRSLIAVEVLRTFQHWLAGRPTETHILKPGEHFPDIERLNAEAPQSEWRDLAGKMVGPWQRAHVLYLIDPKTMEGFTYPTSTIGGARAVSELREATRRARMLRGGNLYPVITLADVHMATKFGGRQRPHFVIKEFIPIGTSRAETPQLAQPSHGKGIESKRSGSEKDLDDSIPF
jgi:hypothetical protein